MMRILYIDDEATTDEEMLTRLTSEGHEITVTGTGQRGIMYASLGLHDLILIDADLPDITGVQVIREMRSLGIAAIILVVSDYACDTVIDTLSAGADAFEEKPFRMEVLLARIRSLQKRVQERVVTTGDLRIDIRTRTVSICERKLRLTAREYVVLVILARCHPEYVSVSELSEILRRMNMATTQGSLTVLICRVRAKIRKACSEQGKSATYIHSRYADGFMLEGRAA